MPLYTRAGIARLFDTAHALIFMAGVQGLSVWAPAGMIRDITIGRQSWT